MNQKGFVNIVIVIIGIIVLAGVVGYSIMNQQTPAPEPILLPTPSPTPAPTLTPTPTVPSQGGAKHWNPNSEYFYYYNKEKIFMRFVGVESGRPVFMMLDPKRNETGQKAFLTDQFIVNLKTGATREDLEALNHKYNVSTVKPMLYSDDEFVLTVKGNSEINALDMANAYHNEAIVEWAQPGLIRQYFRYNI